jgi:hypothetical protein
MFLTFSIVLLLFAQQNNAVRYLTRPWQPSAEAVPAATAPATIPLWTGTADGYTYKMVGQSPLSALTSPTTNIPTPVIPLILTFSDGSVFDPTAPDSVCSSQGTPLSLMLQSPIFNDFNYAPDGTSVGNTEYHDFFQRANFWTYTRPAGVNPNYHLLLNGSSGTPIKITVPAANGTTVAAKCGKLGQVEVNWLNSYLATTGFAQLASNGVLPSSVPVFMLYNVAMYEGTTSTCCVLGYHSAIDNPNFANALQTYAVGDFDTTGNFGNTRDVSSFSHELGELIDDPLGNNPTPPWGNVGEVTGCQGNLEVGDPLTGTNVSITMSNAYTYHVQELAFLSWFYDQSPSIGVNGWYSSNGTFTTPAATCNPTTTTLSITPAILAAGASASVKVSVRPAHGNGTPTGTVALVSSTGGSTLATYTLSGGDVNANITTLPSGSYSVTADYSGDSSYSPSTSAPALVIVGSSAVSFSPIALNFGSQILKTAGAAQTVTVRNIGTAALTGIAISLAGASPGDFTQTNTCASSLAANATCSVSVVFDPTAAGLRTATISVADNGAGSPQTVPLTGDGVVAGSGAISASPTSLAFGSEVVGSATAGQTVTVTNTGTSTLPLVAVRITGQNPEDFSWTTTCRGRIAVNATCTVSVVFRPTEAGSRAASLTVSGDTSTAASATSQAVALTGTGVASGTAGVTLSTSSLSFGSEPIGSRTASQTVTVTNSGTGSLSIVSISVTGTDPRDFFGNTDCPTQLAAAAKCSVTLSFSPQGTGSRAATLSIADSAAGSPQTVALSGTGTQAVSGGPHGH